MPHAHVNGVDLHYLQSGAGDDVLLLCGLGDDLSAWDAQVADELPPPPAVQTGPLTPAGDGSGSTAGTTTGARP